MPDWAPALGGLGGVAAVTVMFTRIVRVENDTTVALIFLLVVLLVAATSRFWVAVVTSIAALVCLNFFFIPPIGTLTVADPENWVALAAFLAVSLVGSNLSAAIQERERIAVDRLHMLEERKHAELARQRDALTSALLDSISHDLRTPLTAIKVAATILHAGAVEEDDRSEQTDIVFAEVNRLERLFQNILEMARIDTRSVAADPRWVHLGEIWDAAREQVAGKLISHRVQLNIDEQWLVYLDPKLTATALSRVLENAAKYSPFGTAIGVSLACSEHQVTIEVSDEGPGIELDDLPRIFDRFFRGDSQARRIDGTGMGLAIARGLLLAEAGRISAENRAAGGARMTMVVPARRRAIEERAVS